MAVLAALYGVKPIKDLLSELPGEQQLQAALLADMWQLPAVSTAAVRLLVDAAKGPGLGLSEAATKAFLGLSAIPNCLLPVFSLVVLAACFANGDSSPSGSDGNSAASGNQWYGSSVSRASLRRLLLTALGDLEAVWADPALVDALMGLPVPAMDLLLSCDELQVGKCWLISSVGCSRRTSQTAATGSDCDALQSLHDDLSSSSLTVTCLCLASRSEPRAGRSSTQPE